jgi:hypothetical protein
MFTSPRYRINEKSVNPLSENVETSTALIVTSQEGISEKSCSKIQRYRSRRRQTHNADGSWKINPMLAVAGETPGKKCKTCVWLCYKQFAKRYYKCRQRNNICAGSPVSEHRVNWPVCGKYKEEEVNTKVLQ